MTHPLEYVKTKAPEDNAYVISPSSFGKFVHQPWNWYREQVLELDKFTGNTASVLGTIVHYCAEQAANRLEVDHDMIYEFVQNLDPEVYDREEIMEHYFTMANVLIQDYVLRNKIIPESQFVYKLGMVDGTPYYVGGTIDALQGDKNSILIADYKTHSNKREPTAITGNYRIQLLVYAFILTRLGYNVDRIRLVYVSKPTGGEISEKTGKRLKYYPSKVTVLTDPVTEEDLLYIESMLSLAVDSMTATKRYPELDYVIWHDPRLLSGENS